MNSTDSNIIVKYQRVLPRDLFNEAKLLKCVGRLTLLIEDRAAFEGLEFDHDGSPFEIKLLIEGSLFIENIKFTLKGHKLLFKTTYNSQSNYPLFCEWKDESCRVFDEGGQFSEDFVEFCGNLR